MAIYPTRASLVNTCFKALYLAMRYPI